MAVRDELLYKRMKYDRTFKDTGGIVDASGKRLRTTRVDGKLYLCVGEEYVRDAFSMEMRPDDTLICGYPKSGAHFAVHYLRGIIRNELHYDFLAKASTMMELAPKEVTDSLPSPRILNTHFLFDEMPKQVNEFKNKIILTRRNPKDTVVSYYNHSYKQKKFYDYDGEFNDYFELFMEGNVDYGDYIDFHLDWEKAIRENPDHPILWVDFEELQVDLPSGLKRISDFLGIQLTDSRAQEIAKSVQFRHMKKAYGDEFFVNKGQVGRWVEWLTDSQSERIDRQMNIRMAGSDYRPRYTL